MSLFDQYVLENFSNLVERSTDVADLGKLSPEETAKLLGTMPQRGAANRFGRYSNEDVAPFLKDIISTILKNPTKKISYADLTDTISKAISSPEYKYEFEGESGSIPGMKMASSFADKWTQNLASTIFTTIQSLKKDAVSKGENVTQSDMKQALTQAVKRFEDKNPTPAEIADEKTPETDSSEPKASTLKSFDQKLESDIYNYLKDGDEELSEIVKYVSRSDIKAAISNANKGDNIVTPADKEKISAEVIGKKNKDVEKALEVLIKNGKVDKTEDGKYTALMAKQEEGEGSGETPFLDVEDEDSAEFNPRDFVDTSMLDTDRSFSNAFEDSANLGKIYIDCFKKGSLLKE
jgi:hypothetical protein